MKNRENKIKLIENGLDKEYSKQRYELRKTIPFKDLDNNELYSDFNGEILSEDDFKDLQAIAKNKKSQRAKIRKQLNYWLGKLDKYDMYFMTFTYDDSKRRKQMTWATLKRYIIREISPNVEDYNLNVDYGSKNERLHAHGFIVVKKGLKVTTEKHKYDNHLIEITKLPFMANYEQKVGFYVAEKIKDDEKSAIKVSRYIAKLELHSIKVHQNYVSTKKGSKYQRYKEHLAKLTKAINTDPKQRTESQWEEINEDLGNYLDINQTLAKEKLGCNDIQSKTGKVIKRLKTGRIDEINWYLNELICKEKQKDRKEKELIDFGF